ncbi:MAG: DNA-3-methyladenine glycosylase [Patescibacteria group bacterium]|nr:DNA-3-methyladenine glycosylase [Patescibacteria group bacterium]
MSVVARSFYKGKTTSIAKNLLGKVLVRHVKPTESGSRATEVENEINKKGIIVETEAYLGPEDKACHSFRGKTERTEVMFGPAGHAYVYLVYGIHYMFNIVTEAPGEAVLVRALEPLGGEFGKRIASGPGKLTKWLNIDKSFNGWDLTKGEGLWISHEPRSSPYLLAGKAGSPAHGAAAREAPGASLAAEDLDHGNFEISSAKRVGVDYAEEWSEKPLRFFIKDNPAVSTAQDSLC